MNKKYIEAKIEKSGDKIVFSATDETLDRAGEVIPLDSWDLKNYSKHPVLLVNHDYRVENIVGLAKNIRKDNLRMTFEPEFHEITELSKNVKEMIEQGFLNSVSVGFLPHGPEKDGDRPSNELLEISFVAVGANPNALRLNALAKSVTDDDKAQVEDWVKQNESMEMQTVICSKEVFKTQEEAATWCKEHDFKSDKVDDTEDSFRYRQFDPERCQDDSFRTIDITDGVKGVVCRPVKAIQPAEVKEEVKEEKMIETEVKEGRIISGKNRELISSAVSILKQATTVLDELLIATEPKTAKDVASKGRDPREEGEVVPRPVLRALQAINRNSNDLLRKIKE
jgi:phage head maturation protease